MKIAILIDGGYLRIVARQAGHAYKPDFIEKLAHACSIEGEDVLRILYYDCAPFRGLVKKPVSGDSHELKGSDLWLKQLAALDLFAVRLGELKFRGFKPKSVPLGGGGALTDEEFAPDFEQKGVDMRIGIDMTVLAREKIVDRLILITGDTDCIPAMKHARKAGLQIVLIELPHQNLAPELLWHMDLRRRVDWPRQT